MGAWQLGVDAARHQRGLLLNEPPQNPLVTIIGRVLKWVPADVVVMFGAAVAVYVADEAEPGVWLIPFFAGLAPVLVVLSAFAGRDKTKPWWTRLLAYRTVVAPFATLIWMYTVPETPWERIKWVADHDTEVIIIAAVTGAMFSLLAQALEDSISDPTEPAWPSKKP